MKKCLTQSQTVTLLQDHYDIIVSTDILTSTEKQKSYKLLAFLFENNFNDRGYSTNLLKDFLRIKKQHVKPLLDKLESLNLITRGTKYNKKQHISKSLAYNKIKNHKSDLFDKDVYYSDKTISTTYTFKYYVDSIVQSIIESAPEVIKTIQKDIIKPIFVYEFDKEELFTDIKGKYPEFKEDNLRAYIQDAIYKDVTIIDFKKYLIESYNDKYKQFKMLPNNNQIKIVNKIFEKF